MLTTKIYDEFVEITGLKDSVYRSVFSKIEEVLFKASEVKFKTFKYKVNDQEAVVDLCEGSVPLHYVEIIQNMFDMFYHFPEDSFLEILVQYHDKEYRIYYDTELHVDSEISFIKSWGIFNLFLLKNPVVDIFREFDRYFNFIEMFNSQESEIFPVLKDRFENKRAHKEILESNITEQTNINNVALINTLETSQKDVFEKLKNIKTELSALINKRDLVIKSVNNIENLFYRKKKLESDNKMYNELLDTYNSKIDEIDEVLSAIYNELTAAADFGKEGVDVGFFTEKKLMFEEEISSIKSLAADTSNMLRDNEGDLKEINKEIGLLEGYNKDDLIVVESNITKYEKSQDTLYAEMLALEGKIKDLKLNKLAKEKDLLNAEISEGSGTFYKLDSKTIIDHITTPKQPVIVTAVVKYLKYSFAYNATKIFDTIETDKYKLSDYDLQAIACRRVLSDVFGFNFKSVFTVYPLINDNMVKVSK